MRGRGKWMLLAVLMGLLFCWNISSITGKAKSGEEPPDAAQEFLEDLDFSDVERMMGELFPQEKIRFSDILEHLMEGDFSGGLRLAGKALSHRMLSILVENKTAMIYILVTALLAAVFANFSHVFAAGQAADTGFFMLYLLFMTLLLQTFEVMMEAVTSSLVLLAEFMQVLCPVYLVAASVVTGSATSAAFYNLLLFLIFLVQNVVCYLILPLIHVYFMIRMMDGLSSEPFLGRLADLVGTAVSWILKTMMVGVVGMNLIQGLISPVLDQVKRSGIQKGLEAIPGIGNTLGGMTEIVLSALTLIRNGIGAAGAVVCVGICLIPLGQIAVMALFYKLMAAVLEPVSDRRMVGCIAGAGDGAVLLMETVYTSGVLFLITIVIVAAIRS